MPPPSPVLPDAACRTCWRRFSSDRLTASMTASMTSSMTALPRPEIASPPVAGHRLPSTRPIDHRWDRSRGIVFNNFKRSLAQHNTWDPSHGIVFSRPPTGSRTYASQELAEEPAPVSFSHEKPLDHTNVPRNGKPVKFSAEDTGRSRNTTDEYRQKVGELEAKVDILSGRTPTKEELIRRFEAHVKQFRDDFRYTQGVSREDKVLENEISEITEVVFQLIRSWESAKPHAKDTERTQLGDQQEQADNNGSRLSGGEIRDGLDGLDGLEVSDTSANGRAGQSSPSPSDRLHTKPEAKQDALRQSDDELQRLSLLLEGERIGFKAELRDQRKSLDAERERTAALQLELDERHERQELYRSNYTLYRKMTEDFTSTILPIVMKTTGLRGLFDKERELWQKAASKFKTVKVASWSSHEYGAVTRSIINYLDGEAVRSSDKLRTLDEVQRQLPALLNSFSQYMHQSRMLTRYHHFQEAWPGHETLDLNTTLQFIEPIIQQLRELTTQAKELEGGKSVTRSRDLTELHSERLRMLHLASITTSARDLQSLKTLLDDDLAEKWVHLKTHSLAARVEAAWKKMRLTNQYSSSRSQSDRRAFRESARHAWVSVEELMSLARRECYLAQQLGRSAEQKQQAEEYIREQIDALESKFRSLTKSFIRATSKETLSKQQTKSEKSTAKLITMRDGQNSRVHDEENQSNIAKSDDSTPAKSEVKGSRLRKFTRSRAHSMDNKMKLSDPAISPAPPSRILNFSPTQADRASQLDASIYHWDRPSQLRRMNWENETLLDELPTHAHASNQHAPDDMHQSTIADAEPLEYSDDRRAESTVSSALPVTSSLSNAQVTDQDDFRFFSSNESESSNNDEDAMDSSCNDESGNLTSLTYHIPPEIFRDAIKSSPETSSAYWNHELYRNQEGKHPATHYCLSLKTAETQAKTLLDEKVLGFDLEWEPWRKESSNSGSSSSSSIKSSVSLIQIATEDRIVLFHIARFTGDRIEDLLPPSLRQILESPDVVKVGVNVSGDATRMLRWLGVKMQGVLELSHLYRVVKYSENDAHLVNFRLVSLSDQVLEVLKLPLKKDGVRVSRWAQTLDRQQTLYAAADAYAGFRLFHELEAERERLLPTPPRPAFVELNQPLILGDGSKIFKSQKRPTVTNKHALKERAEEDDEEDDEYFDAIENLDNSNSALEDYTSASNVDAVWATDTPLPSRNHVKGNDNASAGRESSRSTNTTDSHPKSLSRAQRSNTPELAKADSWVSHWSSSQPPEYIVRAAPRHLRAYHLWHWQNFDLKEVASRCREPPLAVSTVASYIMMAIKEENLPYDSDRVREPLKVLPSSVHGMYQRIIDEINN